MAYIQAGCIRTGAHEPIVLIFADCCWHSRLSYIHNVFLAAQENEAPLIFLLYLVVKYEILLLHTHDKIDQVVVCALITSFI